MSSREKRPEPARKPRRAMTLVEILVVVVLVGTFIPATTAALSKLAQRQSLNTYRELAVILAEEGTEHVFNSGFAYWYPKVRLQLVSNPFANTYKYSPQVFPVNVDVDQTMTVVANGIGDDDPFNPFIGNLGASTNPMTVKPWSNYRREYIFKSRGVPIFPLGKKPPRILECSIRVYYPADTSTGEAHVEIPLYLSNHHPVDTDGSPNNRLRGLLWPDSGTKVDAGTNAIAQLKILPLETPPRTLWGRSLDITVGTTRTFYDSAYPVKLPPPQQFGYPP